eukprot:5752314-Amphidinium_carterae.2
MTKDDYIRLMEERLVANAIEISRRDEIIAKNQAVERNLEEEHRRRNGRTNNRAAAVPTGSETLPKPSPPQPPPPKQPPADLARDMEQAVACAKAKNADTGWASNLVEAAVRAKDAMNSILSTEGPVPVMKPPPTSPPKVPIKPFCSTPYRSDDDDDDEPPEHWEVKTAAAAKQAAELLAKAKEAVYPTEPRTKPPPKELAYVNMTGKAESSCPVQRAILDRNGEGHLPPPPEIKSPPAKGGGPRYTEAEKQAMKRAADKEAQVKLVGYAHSRNDILQHANQALEQAKARQNRQPPVKGSPEHKKSLLKTQPPTKPSPGFPPGTAVPRGFDMISNGRMLYQPALLPTNMLLAQTEAVKLALESLPKTASAQPLIANNGQVMIALMNQGNLPVPVGCDPRWHTPSAVISKSRCRFCETEDEIDRPLQLCWYEHPQTGVKCGKRFCYNTHKRCGARVAYNIKPPSRSGIKDFPECLWCKDHDSIVLPVTKYKHKIGAREDWYFWDPVEALYRAIRTAEAENQMVGAGWRMRQASQGFKKYRASTLNASVVLYREESKVWAMGHHIEEAEEFSRIDSAQYELYLMATCKPYQFAPHSRPVAELWANVPHQRESLLWKIHRERIAAEGCTTYADDPNDENPMVKDGADGEAGEEEAQEYPADVAVYSMVDDSEERENTYRTPCVPSSSRNSPHPPSFSVMLAKMEKRKRKKEISARTRHQHKSLEQCLEEAPWRRADENYQVVEVSDATDDSMPLSALKNVDAKKTGAQDTDKTPRSSTSETSPKRKKKNPEKMMFERLHVQLRYVNRGPRHP